MIATPAGRCRRTTCGAAQLGDPRHPQVLASEPLFLKGGVPKSRPRPCKPRPFRVEAVALSGNVGIYSRDVARHASDRPPRPHG
jgi:hypothetical protein